MTVEATLAERGATHGSFEANALLSQAIKRLIRDNTTATLSPVHREALDMIVLKISRMVTGDPNVKDHALDIAGYATLIVKSIKE